MGGIVRTAALLLSVAFGIIGLSVGINAIVKADDLKSFVRSHVPAGVSVNIDTQDLLAPGAVLTVGSALLALTSTITLLIPYFPRFGSTHKLYRVASFVHFFWALWIFASLVAYDVVARNRQAKVTAFLGAEQLPDAAVQEQEQAMGVTPVYWSHLYLRLPAILPWIVLLFGVIAGVELLRASNVACGAYGAGYFPRRVAAAGVGASRPAETDSEVKEAVPEKSSTEKIESVERETV